MLVYSLVVGTMFLGLFYESTVLPFLTIPPVIKINDVPQLAKVVANGEYHCVTFHEMLIHKMLLRSKREDLRVIGRDLQHNELKNDDIYEFLFCERGKQHLAF